jgi:hypothetical protein
MQKLITGPLDQITLHYVNETDIKQSFHHDHLQPIVNSHFKIQPTAVLHFK